MLWAGFWPCRTKVVVDDGQNRSVSQDIIEILPERVAATGVSSPSFFFPQGTARSGPERRDSCTYQFGDGGIHAQGNVRRRSAAAGAGSFWRCATGTGAASRDAGVAMDGCAAAGSALYISHTAKRSRIHSHSSSDSWAGNWRERRRLQRG